MRVLKNYVLSILLASLFFVPLVCGQKNETLLKKNSAESDHTSYAEIQKILNVNLRQSLDYLDQSKYPSSILYQQIAQNLFDLKQLPLALVYYEKALKLEPRNSNIKSHIINLKNDLGVETYVDNRMNNFMLSSYFSLKEIVNSITIIFVLMILTMTLNIWFPHKLFHFFTKASAGIFLLLLSNFALSWYFDPIEGILIEPTGYYREPSTQYPQLKIFPKKAGTKVRILASNSQGDWLKIMDSEGTVGYIPISSIRII